MDAEKRETIIIGTLGFILSLLLCALGAWMFYLETWGNTTVTYGLFGLEIRRKVLAVIFIWLGLIGLFYSIRRMVNHPSKNTGG